MFAYFVEQKNQIYSLEVQFLLYFNLLFLLHPDLLRCDCNSRPALVCCVETVKKAYVTSLIVREPRLFLCKYGLPYERLKFCTFQLVLRWTSVPWCLLPTELLRSKRMCLFCSSQISLFVNLLHVWNIFIFKDINIPVLLIMMHILLLQMTFVRCM